VRLALESLDDWGLAGTRAYQYRHDVAADAAALSVLRGSGCGVLSEESGLVDADATVVVIVDPVDGSTNASLGIPWYAVSLLAVVDGVPTAALVENLATGERFEATAGRGACRNGQRISPSTCRSLAEAVVGISGLPPASPGWLQFRAFGALALDLCSVACGRLDGFVDCSVDAHGPWDYAGALLVCAEAGVSVGDAFDRPLMVLHHAARRTPVAGATPALWEQLLELRRRQVFVR
jgi:myo-inositol-1(or 4)-monophosphatase